MDQIDGKYRVIKALGKGFGGSVYLVEARGQKMALKQLQARANHDLLSPVEILESFKREFSILKKLNHPHILQILDFGFDPKESFHYFTTEYIEGLDIFQATRGLPYEQTEELFVQALRALSYLHSQRVYHFDIKPTNILVGKNAAGERVAKLIDFGLSAFHKKGILAGSPGYLAPETLLEEGRDGRADLYSLGVTFFTCLTGENPFQGGDLKETIALQKIWTPPRVSAQCPEVPAYLDPILGKLLRKNPAERYHRADQVIRDLNWGGAKRYPLETEATALAYLPGEGELVGREAEWAQLLSFFDRVFLTKSESKECVLLRGGPGTGKTRLLKELKYHAQLHEVQVQELAEANLNDLKSDTLILADNADAETLEIAHQWMRQFNTHSYFLLLAGRELENSRDLGFKITLNNWPQSLVSRYIASVLGIENPPEFLVEELYSRTEGNPLQLTELLQSLLKSHQIFDEHGRWSQSMLNAVGVDFGKLSVPGTIAEYCRNKFSQLTPRTQKTLLAIALSKAPLNGPLLDALVDVEDSKTDLEVLRDERLIAIDQATGHAKLLNPSFLECIPDHLDAGALAALHQELGEILRREPRTERAAWYHLGLGSGGSPERFSFMLKYGQAMLNRSQWSEAAHAFEKASGMAPSIETQVEGKLWEAKAHFRAGLHSKAQGLLEGTQRILRQSRDNPQQWRWVMSTFREMGSIYLKAGRLELARESLQAARVLIEEHEENPVEEMILDNFRASVLMRVGKLEEAEALSRQTYSVWKDFSLEMKKQVLNNELAGIWLAQGKTQDAKLLYQSQAAFHQEIGQTAKQAYALYGWAESAYALKDLEEAVRIFQACIELSKETKNEELLFHSFNGLGNISFSQKNWPQAARHYQEALELSQHFADNDSSVGIAINLALVLRFQGDDSSALLYLQHAIDTLERQPPATLHHLELLVQAYLEKGSLHQESFRWMDARDSYRDAAHLVRTRPSLERFRFSALMGIVQADMQLERDEEAEAILKDLDKGSLSPSEREALEEMKLAMKRRRNLGK